MNCLFFIDSFYIIFIYSEVLKAVRDKDETVVAFALYIAKSHKQLNTMNTDRQTVLHIAAKTCSAYLCRLLITKGCDGAIADIWGMYMCKLKILKQNKFFNTVEKFCVKYVL